MPYGEDFGGVRGMPVAGGHGAHQVFIAERELGGEVYGREDYPGVRTGPEAAEGAAAADEMLIPIRNLGAAVADAAQQRFAEGPL